MSQTYLIRDFSHFSVQETTYFLVCISPLMEVYQYKEKLKWLDLMPLLQFGPLFFLWYNSFLSLNTISGQVIHKQKHNLKLCRNMSAYWLFRPRQWDTTERERKLFGLGLWISGWWSWWEISAIGFWANIAYCSSIAIWESLEICWRGMTSGHSLCSSTDNCYHSASFRF